MRRSFTSSDSDNVEINLSAMIDMVFILLIFFIVTTVFVEETGIEVNKPEAAAAVPLESNLRRS
jgi:biopolymer transport protein ExbD